MKISLTTETKQKWEGDVDDKESRFGWFTADLNKGSLSMSSMIRDATTENLLPYFNNLERFIKKVKEDLGLEKKS